jgi:hypothetical protein
MIQDAFALLLESAARTAAAGSVAALAMAVLRRRDAATSSAVWTAVLAAGLLMPLAVTITPRIALWTVPAPATPVVAMPLGPALRTADPAPVPVPAIDAVGWTGIAAWLYFAVAATLLLRVAAGLWWAGRLRRRATPIAGFAPGVYASSDIDVPVTVGVFERAVVLPSSWAQWEARKTEAVLLHESAHVARGDFAVQLAASVYEAVFWFSPFSWWIRRRLAALAEQAADDRALHSLQDRPFYAEVVLGFVGVKPVRSAAVPMARGSQVGARIDRILSGRASAGVAGAGARAMIAALGVPVLFLSAALGWGQAPPPPPPPTPPSAAPADAPPPPPPAGQQRPTRPARTARPAVDDTDRPSASPSPFPVPAPVPPAPPAAPAAVPEVPPPPPPPPAPARSSRRRNWWHFENGGNLLFERDGRQYRVDDPEILANATELFASVRAQTVDEESLEAKQRAIEEVQQTLEKQLEQSGRPLDQLVAEIERMRGGLESSERRAEGARDRIEQAHARIAELQARMHEKMAAATQVIARKQAELERWRFEMEKRLAEAQRTLDRQMRDLIDQAIREGKAKPVR